MPSPVSQPSSVPVTGTVTGGDLIERAWATFDRARTYRYVLVRRWGPGPAMVVLMLNPSVADAFIVDPTVRRGLGFAKRERCGSYTALNLFALRSTDPKALYRHRDPIGPANDTFLARQTAGADIVVAAWGAHGAVGNRGTHVAQTLAEQGITLHCLGTTKHGHPRHPLYVPADTPLRTYRPDQTRQEMFA